MSVEADKAGMREVISVFSENEIFAEALRDPDRDVPDGIMGPDGLTAPKRFSVYRNNVALSLREALEQTYPGIYKIVGVDNFNILASIYFSKYPPATAMMHAYGDRFPEFLSEFEPLQHSPFLVDLAKVEKAWIEAYHASDLAILDAEELGKIPAEQLLQTRFNPHPACCIISSPYHLYDLYCSRDEEGECTASYEMMETPGSVVVSRPYLEVLVNKLSHVETEFFNMLMNKSTLGESVEMAVGLESDFDVSAAITLMLSTGIMCSISTSNPLEQ